MTSPEHGHLDLDTLAELDEGLLGAAEAAANDAHLASCQRCRADLARIRAVRVVLGALPEEPMPAQVSDRLEAALAGAASTGTVVPMERPKRGWRAHPTAAGLSAAAAGVALLTAIVLGSTLHSDNPPDSNLPAGSAEGALPNAAPSFPLEVAGRHYNPANAPALIAAAAEQAKAPSTDATTAPTDSKVGASQTNSTADTVPTALQTLYTDPQALMHCIDALSGAPGTVPVAVDFGRFTDRANHRVDRPAIVVLLPGPPGKIEGWIVGPACATAPDNNLYLFKRVPVPAG